MSNPFFNVFGKTSKIKEQKENILNNIQEYFKRHKLIILGRDEKGRFVEYNLNKIIKELENKN